MNISVLSTFKYEAEIDIVIAFGKKNIKRQEHFVNAQNS